MNSPLRSRLPSVAQLLETPVLKSLADRISQHVLVQRARDLLDDLRTELQQAVSEARAPDVLELAERIARRVVVERASPLQAAINATGVILPEGLGEPPLPSAAVEALRAVAGEYCNLDLDWRTGGGNRAAHLQRALCGLAGAEAALVVNNHAAATLLALSALAAGRDVLVSRGQIVAQGESYRLPELFAASGARLREVGAVNRTTLGDYEQAATPETAAVLVVQRSNFQIVGCAEEPSAPELAAFARGRRLPLIQDLPSGAPVELTEFGCPGHPTWSSCLGGGAGVLISCANRLLGGPQCGILLGRADLISRLERHPLAKALHLDKLRLSALSATLSLYGQRTTLRESPVLQLLAAPPENLRNRAERLAPQLAACRTVASAEPVSEATAGHESIFAPPAGRTWCIAIRPRSETAASLADRLRSGSPAVVARLQEDRLLLDLRSVLPRQDLPLVAAFERLDGQAAETPPRPTEQRSTA